MLWRTADLLVAGQDRLQAQEIGALDEILIRLTECMQSPVLIRLSTALADLRGAPEKTLQRLAFHDDPAVAAPLLLKSPAISNDDLIAIAAFRGEQHLLVIARRHEIDPALSEALLKRGGKNVQLALVKNPGARFSEAGYAMLLAKAERDDEITKELALRPGVPETVLRDLLSGSPRSSPGSPARAPDTKPPRTIDYAEASSEITALNRIGKLNDSTVNRFAVRGETAKLIAALSALSGAPIEIVEGIMADTAPEALVMACRASRLNWQTTLSILSHRGTARLSYEDRERAQQLFESLYLSTSQWAVRWGEMAARAGSISPQNNNIAKSGAGR